MFRSMLIALILMITLSVPIASAQSGDLRPGDGSTSSEKAENPGLIEEGAYVSPQFGLGINWEPSWQLGPIDHPAVIHANGGYWSGSVDSVPDVGDIVILMDTATESAVLTLGFSYLSPNVSIPDVLAFMGEPEYLTHNLFISANAEILLIDSSATSVAVLARNAAPNNNHFVYQMMVLDPGSENFGFWVGLDLYDPASAPNILASIEQDVQVEDNDIFSVLTMDEMLEAMSKDPGTRMPGPSIGLMAPIISSRQEFTP